MTNVISLNNTIENVRQAALGIITAGEKTLTAISKEAAISTSALSQFMKSKYTGDNEEVASKLQRWLNNRTARLDVVPSFDTPRFIETETVKLINQTLIYAQLSKRISIIYGNSGVGKTAALREFAANNPNVWLVTARPSTSELTQCLIEIAETMGLTDTARRAGSVGRAIRRRVAGTNGLLIIDEADHLDYAVFEELRLLQEETGIGLALCGNHRVYSKLTGGNNRTVDFARLFSRVAKRLVIEKPRRNDIDAIAEAWQLNDETDRQLIRALASKGGALRTVSTTLDLASIIAQGAGEKLSDRHIRLAVKDLEGI